MGDNDHGHAAFCHVLNDGENLLDHLRVQGGGGLVKEHHLRLHGQGTHNGKPLLLAAGQTAGILLRLVREAHPRQKGQSLPLGLLLGHLLLQNRGQGDVFQHRQVGKYVEILEYHADFLTKAADLRFFGRELPAVKENLSGGGLLQQVEAAQQGALASAGGADDGENLLPVDRGGDSLQNLQSAKPLGQVRGLQNDLLSHRLPASSPCRTPPRTGRSPAEGKRRPLQSGAVGPGRWPTARFCSWSSAPPRKTPRPGRSL